MTGFQNEFKGVTRGSDLLLRWDVNATASYPLVVYSRLINQTSESGANSLEINITTGLNATSFLWKCVPYPLPYLATALYEVEVRPQNQVGSKGAIASSSYFTVSSESDEEDKNENGLMNPFNETTILPSRPTNQPVSQGGVNNNTAIAAGLVVPVFVILAIFGFVWLQRRQKKIIEEKRKQREDLCID
ncbi:uncharacterized protein F4812DRAFT_465905 [Daldinia caldariorum]|uniref:uncharacterized protein n=1 Tax=Daldinia caldariorum TaxID=326644 RepID=UPI0020079AA6|nr:uncharacterized protein F4812DRAFT_465905 [Daldinia caldariorum]KAI1466021.1 hypothetical protein F4812DRAFT_465905 [Daldinia caldariorum]